MSVKVTPSSSNGVLTGPANCKICFESIKSDSKVPNADTGLMFVGKPMHKKCCKCSECGALITVEGFASMRPTEAKQRKLLCPPHYIKKFGEKGIIRLQARMRRFLVVTHMEEIRKRQILLKRLFPYIIKIQKLYRGYKARQRMAFVKNKIYNRIKSDLPKQLTRLNRLRPKEQNINDMVFNIFSEFPEFSRPQLESYTRLFHAYDLDRTGKITVEGLKKMMEKLGSPQTHLQLRSMIREANMDRKIREVNGKLTLDGSIDLRDFIRLFQRRNKGELLPSMGNVLNIMSTKQIDVQEVGVQNAKKFFDAKAAITTQMGDITLNEVKTITQGNQIKREEKAIKQAEFDAKRSMYTKKK